MTEDEQKQADLWWSQNATRVPQAPMPITSLNIDEPWRWSYSRWVGVKYGPIPIGLIVGLPLMILLLWR